MKIDKIYSKKIDAIVNALENPEISRKALWGVVASDLYGNRYQHEYLFQTEKEAEDFAAKALAAQKVSLEGWTMTSPVYGSKAYWENPYCD